MNCRVKFLIAIFVGSIALASASAGALEGSTSSAAVKRLAKNLYSQKSASFEFGEFNGKFNPRLKCVLLKSFYEESLLVASNRLGGCDFKYDATSVRYPGLQIDELSESGSIYPARIIPVFLGEPIFVDGIASIEIVFSRSDNRGAIVDNFGRVLLFLRSDGSSWRVFNALLYREYWGRDKPESCRGIGYSFLTPPITLHELQDLPADCKSQEERALKSVQKPAKQ